MHIYIDEAGPFLEKALLSGLPDRQRSVAHKNLALVYEKQEQYDSTIKTLDRIYAYYPHSKQASKALFLEGFLYANVLHQLDKAKEKYELYLKDYSAVDSKITNDVDDYGDTGEATINAFYECLLVPGDPRPDDDVAELAWFEPDALPAAGPSAVGIEAQCGPPSGR